MTGTAGTGGIRDRQPMKSTPFMHGHFHAFDLGRLTLVTPQFASHPECSLSQQFPDPLPIDNHLEQFDNGLTVAPLQIHPGPKIFALTTASDGAAQTGIIFYSVSLPQGLTGYLLDRKNRLGEVFGR